jgi:hypothetical protein
MKDNEQNEPIRKCIVLKSFPPPQRKKFKMNVGKELNLRKKMDGMKIVNNEFMKLLNLKK